MLTKNFLKSKEVWATLLTIAIFIAKIFGIEPDESVLSQLTTAYVGVYPFIILILRVFFTNSKLTLN